MKTDRAQKGRCIIYTRFSPRKNAENCESCEIQKAYCEQYAAQKGWEVVAVYSDEAVSGSTDVGDRNLDAAIHALKRGWVLLAHKRDRFARDLQIGLQIERMVETRGATCAVASGEIYGKNPNAQFMKHILMAAAEWERKIIAERTRQSMLQHQRNGRRMSHALPYGWKEDPSDPKRMVSDEAQQNVIKDIVSMRDGGESFGAIAKALNRKGGTKATQWTATGVLRVYRREKR